MEEEEGGEEEGFEYVVCGGGENPTVNRVYQGPVGEQRSEPLRNYCIEYSRPNREEEERPIFIRTLTPSFLPSSLPPPPRPSVFFFLPFIIIQLPGKSRKSHAWVSSSSLLKTTFF